MKNLIIKEKLIVLFREMEMQDFIKCVETLYRAGVRVLEICYNAKNFLDDDALKKIRYIKENYDDLCVGAGTTLTAAQVIAAKNAGADFIVSPVCEAEVIKETKKLGMISIPGAFTATECYDAYKLGADFVKIFPLMENNVNYLNVITTPLPEMKYVATGNINENNIPLFLSKGASVVGTGVSILKKDLITKGAYDEIYELAKKHVQAVKGEKEEV